MKLFFVLLFFFAPKIFAVELTCSKKGTQVLYLNGVLNTADQALKSMVTIKELLEKANSSGVINATALIDKNKVEVDFMYNESIGILDFYETAAQKLEERGVQDSWKLLAELTWGVANLSTGLTSSPAKRTIAKTILASLKADFIQGFNDFDNNQSLHLAAFKNNVKFHMDRDKKVIVISHSQGSLFANELNRVLFEDASVSTEFREKQAYYGNLQIASPTASLGAANSEYITVSEDGIIGALRIANFGNVLPSNYDITQSLYEVWDLDIFGAIFGDNAELDPGHGLDRTYLSTHFTADTIPPSGKIKTMEAIFLEKLNKVALKLASNCCDMTDGIGDYASLESVNYTSHDYQFNSRNTWGAFTPSATTECRVPAQRESYTNYLGNLISTVSDSGPYAAPAFEYLGCTNDGKISRPVVALTAPYTSDFPSVWYGLVCDEQIETSYKDTDAWFLKSSLYMSTDISGRYVAMTSFPLCYRYRAMASDGTNFAQKFGTLDLPVEDCMDCAKGTVKINGECTCPEGMSLTEEGCKRKIVCETNEDYFNGKCQCSGKPFKADYGYTCDTPPESPPIPEAEYPVVTRGSAQLDGCSESGFPVVKVTIPKPVWVGYSAQSRMYCVGQSSYFKEGRPFSDGGLPIDSEYNESYSTHSYEMKGVAHCYKWVIEFTADDGTYERIPVPEISYPFCN